MGEGGAVGLDLRFTGVSPLFRGFFSEPRMIGPLGSGLGTCLDDEVVIAIGWDGDENLGHITIEAEPRELGCLPVKTATGWDLSPLEPLGRTLAAYRDRVSGNYDLRVASFRTRISLLRGTRLCTLRLAGQYPPDGSTWSPCVEFAGKPHCAQGGDGVVELRFEDPADAAYFSACVGS